MKITSDNNTTTFTPPALKTDCNDSATRPGLHPAPPRTHVIVVAIILHSTASPSSCSTLTVERGRHVITPGGHPHLHTTYCLYKPSQQAPGRVRADMKTLPEDIYIYTPPATEDGLL